MNISTTTCTIIGSTTTECITDYSHFSYGDILTIMFLMFIFIILFFNFIKPQ